MKKYNSKYTKDQFEYALDLLQNNWIQLKVSGGSPGQEVNLSIGDYYIVTNLISQYTAWKAVNCTGSTADSGFDAMKYKNYNLLRVVSYTSGGTQTNSKILYDFLSKQNHIYYFSAVADGIRANENESTNNYYSNINNYCIAIEDGSSNRISTSDVKNDLGVYRLSCIGKTTSSSKYYMSMYSNLSQSNAGGSVYFGYMQAVDLTADLGITDMPTIGTDEYISLLQWCDSNLNFVSGNRYRQNLQVYKPTNTEVNNVLIEDEFNTDGECIFNLPSYGIYTPNVNVDLPGNIVASNYYGSFEVDTVKRYELDLPYNYYIYPKEGTIEETIMFRYSAINSLMFIGYLVVKDGVYQMISEIPLSDIVSGDAGIVNYYVYNKVEGREDKYSSYENDTPVKSGVATWNKNIKGYVAEWANTTTTWENRLPNGDYVYYLVPNTYYWAEVS